MTRYGFWRGGRLVALFLLAVWLALPAVALADSATTAPTQVLPWQQLWPILIGAATPLATYALNYAAPWVSEPLKAFVLLLVSAAATALYTALATDQFGLNGATLQLVLTSMASSLATHHALWKPAGISAALGGGQNRQPTVGGRPIKVPGVATVSGMPAPPPPPPPAPKSQPLAQPPTPLPPSAPPGSDVRATGL